MRDWRARKKAGEAAPVDEATFGELIRHLEAENGRLVEEVAHLKRELAQRPQVTPYPGPVETNSSGPLPVVDTVTYGDSARRARQALIDATLGKVNRVKRR